MLQPIVYIYIHFRFLLQVSSNVNQAFIFFKMLDNKEKLAYLSRKIIVLAKLADSQIQLKISIPYPEIKPA